MNAKKTVEAQVEVNAAEVVVVAPAAPKLTRTEKLLKRIELLKTRIESDTKEYQEIANELNNADALKNLAIGSKVTIKLGRKFADKDTTRIVEGTIIGIRAEDEDGGVQYKVTHGVGFDADIAVVGAGGIQSVITDEAAPAA